MANKYDGSIVINTEIDQSDFKKALDSLGSIATGALSAVGATAVAAGTAAAAAAAKLGEEVISAYADYEQLVGGVDTLFKESSLAVQGYAENAFKTAGLSANEYMETVTSFSASLIQSLGGNTAEAAKVADMAITDMADNANKMGTDIASIQNAYQGFAKQNYTMLDNLKLGYGGTKAEMERLLADAEKISGIKYDLSSFADLTEAIHVIQTEMGITGTTALEAADTISGSMSSMNSAISNLMAGLGNANADVELLMDNVVEAFQNVVKNITPVIENIIKGLPSALDGVLQAVGDLLPALLSTVTNLFTQVLSTVSSLLPELIPVAANAIMTIVNALIDNIPLVVDAMIQMISAIGDGIIAALPELVAMGREIIVAIINGMIEAFPEASKAFIELKNIFNDLYDIVSNVFTNISNDIVKSGILTTIIDLIGQILEVVSRLMPAIEVIGEIISAVVNVAIQILANWLQTLSDNFDAVIVLIIAATIEFGVLNAVMAANPVGAVISLLVALAGVVAAICLDFQETTEQVNYLSEAQEQLVLQINATNEAYKETMAAVEEQGVALDGLYTSLESLLAIEERNAAQEESLKAIIEQLNTAVPNLGLAYDDLSGSINLTTEQIKLLIDMQEQQAVAQAKLELFTETYKQQAAVQAELNKAAAEYHSINAERVELETKHAQLLDRLNEEMSNNADTVDATTEEIIELAGEISELTKEEDKAWTAVRKLSTLNGELINTVEEAEKEYNNLINTLDETSGKIEELGDSENDLIGTTDGLGDEVDDTTDSMEDYTATAKKAIQVTEDFDDAISPLTNSIKLLESRVKVLKSEYDDLSSSQEGITRVTEALNDVIDEHTVAIEITTAAQKACEQSVIELEAENEALNARLIENIAIMDTLNLANAEGAARYAELEAENASFSNQIAINTQLLAENISYIDELQLRINNYTIASNNYRSEIKSLNTTVKSTGGSAKKASDETKKAAEKMDEAGKLIQDSIKDTKSAVEELTKAYDNAYNSAYNSAMGQLDLFKELTEAAEDTYVIDTVALQGVIKDMAVGSMESVDDLINAVKKSSDITEVYVTDFVHTISQLDPAVEYTFDELKALFVQVEEDTTKVTDTMLENLRNHAQEVAKYNEDIKRAMEVGFSEGFVGTLTDGSEDSKKALQALLEEFDSITGEDGLDSQKAIDFVDEFNNAFADTEYAADELAHTVAEMETNFTERAAVLVQQAQQMANDVSTYTGNSFEELKENLDDLMTSVAEMGEVRGQEMVDGLIVGLDKSKQDAIDDVKAMAEAMDDGVTETFGIASPSKVFESHGNDIIQGLINGLDGLTEDLFLLLDAIAHKVINIFVETLEISESESAVFKDIGNNIIQGLLNGLQENASGVTSVLSDLANSMITTFKDALEIHSPSEVFYDAATEINAGIAAGLGDKSKLDLIEERANHVRSLLVDSINGGGIVEEIQASILAAIKNQDLSALRAIIEQYGLMYSDFVNTGEYIDFEGQLVNFTAFEDLHDDIRKMLTKDKKMSNDDAANFFNSLFPSTAQLDSFVEETYPAWHRLRQTATEEITNMRSDIYVQLQALKDDLGTFEHIIDTSIYESVLQSSFENLSTYGETMEEYREAMNVARTAWEAGGEAWEVYEAHIEQQQTVVDLQEEVNRQFNRMLESKTTDDVTGITAYNQAAIDSYDELILKLQEAEEQLQKTSEAFDTLSEAVAEGIVDEIYATAAGIEEAFGDLSNVFSEAMVNSIDSEAWAKYVAEMTAQGFEIGIRDSQGNIISALDSLTTAVKDKVESDFGVASPSEVFKQYGMFLVDGLIVGLTDDKKTEDLLEATTEFTSGIKDAFKDDMGIDSSGRLPSEVFRQYAGLMTDGISLGIVENIDNVLENVRDMDGRITETVKEDLDTDTFEPIGEQITNGLTTGIISGQSGAINAIQQLAASVIAAAQSAFQIHSPSKVFDYFGSMLMAGMTQGIVNNEDNVLSSIIGLNDNIKSEMEKVSAMRNVIANVGGVSQRELSLAKTHSEGITNYNNAVYNNINNTTIESGATQYSIYSAEKRAKKQVTKRGY